MRLIGLNGRLHSGKDTAFEIIEKDSTVGLRSAVVKRVAFADKLKLSVARLFDPEINLEEAIEFCNWLKEHGEVALYTDTSVDPIQTETGRTILQRHGTEAHRDVFGDEFWVDALLPRPVAHGLNQDRWLRDSFPGIDVLVVTDVRFPNEAKRILQLGGEVWHIEADRRLGPLPEDAHPSERPLPRTLITRTVENNLGLDAFGVNVRRALAA